MRANQAKAKLRQGNVVTVVSGHGDTDMIDYLGQFGLDGIWIEG